MNKLYLTPVLVFISIYFCTSQIIDIPDPVFKSELLDVGLDLNGDGELEVSEVDTITILDLRGGQISDLTGIEYFGLLEEIFIVATTIEKLYLPENKELIKIHWWFGDTKEVDISPNQKLEFLEIRGHQLTELDVSQNPGLKTLYYQDNNVLNIDLSNNANLEKLNCSGNELTTLDLLDLPRLTHLYCHENNLTELDVRANPLLDIFLCDNNELEALDLSNNPKLGWLRCHDNNLTELDISQNNKLFSVDCSHNAIKSMDIENPELYKFICNHNDLRYLSIKNGFTFIELKMNSNRDLEFVCVDTFQREYDMVAAQVGADVVIDTICSNYISEIKEIKPDTAVVIRPNPCKDEIYIEAAGMDQLYLLDQWGRHIENHFLKGASSIRLAMGHLQPGLYYVQCRNLATNKATLMKIMKI